jgi:uncharacterized delta-60 repeat protein
MFTPFAFIQPIVYVSPALSAIQYLLMGGSFTNYNSPSVPFIAKIDSTGSLDSTFNIGTGFDGVGYEIKQQPDGKYIVGGVATVYSGSSAQRLIRINHDGTRDATLNVGTTNGLVYAIACQSDNSNVIGGGFTTYSGSSINRIVKITPSGTIDNTFNIGFGINGAVNDMITQTDGKIIVGGNFTQYSSSNNFNTRTDLSGSYNAGPGSTFNTGTGFTALVNTYATQSDGKIIAAGNFTNYSGSAVNRITRINTDGTRDLSFNVGTGVGSVINKIIIQPDGKIIATGNFTLYSGSASSGIVRINTNGTRDTTFNVGGGLVSTNGIDVLLQSDGKIIIAGGFTQYSGSTANRITRLNTDGTIDSTFNTGTAFGSNVNSISIQPDGKIIASGNFTTYSGSAINYITRLNTDGTRDLSFNVGTGGSLAIFKNTIDPVTGKIIIMGNFTTYSGSSTNTTRLMRLNTDGTQDTTFITGTGLSGGTLTPTHLSIEADGKLYLTNNFTTYSGSVVNNFARINSNGTLDNTFVYASTSSAAGFNSSVRTVLISGSNIYFAGDFSAYRPTRNLIRLNTNGTIDTTFAIGESTPINNLITALSLQSDGKIIIAGGFTQYSGSTANRITRLNTDGTIDSTFNTGTGLNSTPYSIDVQPDGKILALGNFSNYSGSTQGYMTRINTDGTRDTTFNIGSGYSFPGTLVKGMKILYSSNDNKIYVTNGGGGTISYSGSTPGNIMRINPNGTLDTTFVTTASANSTLRTAQYNQATGFAGTTSPGGYSLITSGSSVIVVGSFNLYKNIRLNSGLMITSTGNISSSFNVGADGQVSSGLAFNNVVQTWATQSDGKIIAGGAFTTYSGSASSGIVRINTNGTRDTTFNIGTGFNNSVFDTRIQPDGKIIAIGNFTTYSGSASSGIVRINTNGTRDTTFNVGAGFTGDVSVKHCKIQSDGKIIVVGGYSNYSGSAQTRITRINTDGTLDNTFNTGAGFNAPVESVILQPDGKIIVAGSFSTYSGSAIAFITRLNTDGTRDTTFNTGTGLTNIAYALALQSDGKIICANASTTYSGSTNRYIIRINSNGTLDNTFNANADATLSTTLTTPNSLVIDNNGSIYWGNNFTTFSGSFTPNRIVRLNNNGSVDETFNQEFLNISNGTGKGANGIVTALLLI